MTVNERFSLDGLTNKHAQASMHMQTTRYYSQLVITVRRLLLLFTLGGFYMKPNMKTYQNEISNRFDFASVYMTKLLGRLENSSMQFPCKTMLVHFENKHGREK